MRHGPLNVKNRSFILTYLTKLHVPMVLRENYFFLDVFELYAYWTVHHCDSWRIKDQLDVTCSFLFHFWCAQHVSDINISIISSLRLFCWITTSCASACNTDTTPTQPHRISNTHRTKNNTTNVVIQQNSRKLLVMDILMSLTCWAHKKWNKKEQVTSSWSFILQLSQWCMVQ